MARDGEDKWLETIYANTHQILGNALRAAPAAARPAPPYHLGGPRPRPTSDDLVRIGLRSAARVSQLVPADQQADFDASCELCEDYLATKPAERRRWEQRLWERGQKHRSRPNPFPVSSMICVATSNCASRHTDRAIDSLRAVAVRVVECLDDPRDYLIDLDRWLVLSECASGVAKYAPERQGDVAEVLFRHDRGNGVAGHFIFRLKDGELGLITKHKGRYRFFTGDQKTLLATLPTEELFSAAVAALV